MADKFLANGRRCVIDNQFNNSGLFMVSSPGGATFRGVGFKDSGTVAVNGGGLTLDLGNHVLQPGVRFTGPGRTRVTGAPVILEGDISLDRDSTFEVASGSTSAGGTLYGTGTFTGSGTLQWSGGTIYATLTIPAEGTLLISGAGDKMLNASFDGGVIHNAGTARWTGAGRIVLDREALFNNSGAFDAQSDASFFATSCCVAQNTFNNTGTFIKSAGGGATEFRGVFFNNLGTVEVQSGVLQIALSRYTQMDGLTRLNGGHMASATPVDIQGGILSGSGTIAANVSNAGQISPGDSAGALNITGTYTQADTGSLHIEIGGLNPGTEFDQLNITGQAVLDGTLNISRINQYIPNPGDSFQIMSFGSRSGDFAVIDGLKIGGGLSFMPVFNPTNLTLVTQAR